MRELEAAASINSKHIGEYETFHTLSMTLQELTALQPRWIEAQQLKAQTSWLLSITSFFTFQTIPQPAKQSSIELRDFYKILIAYTSKKQPFLLLGPLWSDFRWLGATIRSRDLDFLLHSLPQFPILAAPCPDPLMGISKVEFFSILLRLPSRDSVGWPLFFYFVIGLSW